MGRHRRRWRTGGHDGGGNGREKRSQGDSHREERIARQKIAHHGRWQVQCRQNSEFDTRKFLEKFKGNGKFLFSAFSQWSVQETLDFFHEHGVATKVENELRTFPVSNSAQSVWNVLAEYLKKNKVTIRSNSPVAGIMRDGGKITGVMLENKKPVRGRSIIIATGGTSRPETGSTGDGYAWLKNIGHTIVEPTPSLVPLAMKDPWIKRLAGVKLNDIKITVFQNNEKQNVLRGKILFTHVGVSGPTILNMSKDIGELLKIRRGHARARSFAHRGFREA